MRRWNKRTSQSRGAGGSSSSQPQNEDTGDAGGSGARSNQQVNQDVGGYIPTFTNPSYDQTWGSQFPQMTPEQLFQQQQLYAAYQASSQAQAQQNWLLNSYAAYQTPSPRSPRPPPIARSPQFATPSPFQTPSPRTPSNYGSPDTYVEETQEVETQEEEYYQQQEEDEEDDDEDDDGGDKHRGKAARKNWTYFEEEMLAEAWCGVSEDARYGNDQNVKQFWKAVTARFNSAVDKGPKYRTMDQCNSKFNKMNREVQKFNGAYVNLRNQPRSGENEADLLTRAEKMYSSDTMKKWKFPHVWRVVKDNGKWNQLPLMDDVAKRGKRRNKLSTQHLPTSQADPYDVDDDDRNSIPESRPLPMGRDRVKKKAKTSSSSSARSEEFGDLKNQFASLNANFSQRNELRAMEIYMQDVRHLQGEALEAAMAMKAKIKAKYNF